MWALANFQSSNQHLSQVYSQPEQIKLQYNKGATAQVISHHSMDLSSAKWLRNISSEPKRDLSLPKTPKRR